MKSVRASRHTKGEVRRGLKVGVIASVVVLASVLVSGCQAVVNSSSAIYETKVSSSSSNISAGAAPKSQVKERSTSSKKKLSPRARRTFEVVGTGDLMIHPSIAATAERMGSVDEPNFYHSLAGVQRRVKSADLAVCHVETPFSEPGVKTIYPHYFVHPNLAKAIAQVGFRECSTASNWTADKGRVGAERTVTALKNVGVGQSGIRVPDSVPPFKIRKIKGVKVAHLSYTDPSDSPGANEPGWAVNNGSPSEIALQAHQARKQGAEIVVVSLAMGLMGADATTEGQESAIHAITQNDDVDLVIGHGSHTVQPAQKVNGTWVIWHGNLLSSFFPNQQNMHIGLLSHVKFKEVSKGKFEAVSAAGYPVLAQPGTGEVVDLATQDCLAVKDKYDWYAKHLQKVEEKAVAQGFKLGQPCGVSV